MEEEYQKANEKGTYSNTYTVLLALQTGCQKLRLKAREREIAQIK